MVEHFIDKRQNFTLEYHAPILAKRQPKGNFLYWSGPLAVIIRVECFVETTLGKSKVNLIPFVFDVKSKMLHDFFYFLFGVSERGMM